MPPRAPSPVPVARRSLGVLALAAMAVLLWPVAAAQARASDADVRLALSRLVAKSGLSSGASVSVRDEDGDVVFTHQDRVPRVPASNEKLVTEFAALDQLGADHRFETRLARHGAVTAGVLHGDLFLVGAGDPMLATASFARRTFRGPVATIEALAKAVRAAGIRRVTGRVIADGSAFDRLRAGPLWKVGFAGLECPPLAGLGVDRNLVRGKPVARPEIAAARALRAALIRVGVRIDGGVVEGRVPPGAPAVASGFSPALDRVLWPMGKDSDNFTAEMVLKATAAAKRGRGTTSGGAALARSSLKERLLPLAGVRIVDGSGLSGENRLTADLLTALLVEARSDPALAAPLTASLSVAGVDGTLRDRMRDGPARRVVRAKTGTLSQASALSGYAGRFSFSVLVNAPGLNQWSAHTLQDRIAVALVKRA